MPEYFYGIREDGTTVSIDDILPEEYGERCGCRCPTCQRAFQACALQSETVNRYFRHVAEDREGGGAGNPDGCTPNGANETGLHRLAKEIIAGERRICVPPVEVKRKDLKLGLPENIRNKLPKVCEYLKAGTLICTDILLETPEADFVPDAIALTARGKCLIEFAVTHFVDDEKKAKAIKNRVPMMEIDLSDFLEKPVSREDLRKIIVENNEHKSWVYHPRMDEAMKYAYECFMSDPVVQKYLREHEEEVKRAKWREEKEERQWQKWRRLREPENYAAELARLRSDNAFFQKAVHQAPHDFWFYRQHKKVPFFIDLPVTYEMVFQCDRRIWQGTIFNRYVYSRKEANAKINVWNIYKDLKETHKIPLDYELPYYDLATAAIKSYLEYLEFIGFITIEPRVGRWATVHAVRTIIPPSKADTDLLLEILKKTELNLPDTDAIIGKALREHQMAVFEKEKEEGRQRQLQAEKLKEEQKKAAEARRLEKAQAAQKAFEEANYDQDDELIYDPSGVRWMKCTVCNRKMPGFKISKHLSMNRGVCRACKPIWLKQQNQQK